MGPLLHPRLTPLVPFPVSQAVTDGDLTVRVRRIAGEVQVACEVYSFSSDSIATLTLPRMSAQTACQLARLLLEAAAGQAVAMEQGYGDGQAPTLDGLRRGL